MPVHSPLHNHQTTDQGRYSQRQTIVLFAPSLGGGGAERHLLRIATYLDREKFRPIIAVARAGGSYENSLPEDIPLIAFNSANSPSSTLRLLRSIRPLRKLIRQEHPAILFSVIDVANITALLASRGENIKTVVSVQNPPSIIHGRSRSPVSKVILKLIPRLYPSADQIIALSSGVEKDIHTVSPNLSDHTSVIYNAGLDDEIAPLMTESILRPERQSLLVAVGRLAPQKGFSFLIDAMKDVPDAHLWILGEGKLRQELERQIADLNLQARVKLLGHQKNPYALMKSADIFVLSSLFEGFGNVIVEAMACKTAVIATDCPYGPGEIISHDVNGLLVESANPTALAQAINDLLNDPNKRARLAEAGAMRAKDFHANKIAEQHAQLFERLIEQP